MPQLLAMKLKSQRRMQIKTAKKRTVKRLFKLLKNLKWLKKRSKRRMIMYSA